MRHKFKEVNTFREENFGPKYQQINPSASIPIITCKDTKCLGDQLSLYEFLYNTDLGARVMFYSEEQEPVMKSIMSWFQKVMRQTTSKLIRRVYIQKVLKL